MDEAVGAARQPHQLSQLGQLVQRERADPDA